MFNKTLFNIYCMDIDLDMTKKAIEELGIQMEPARELSTFEKSLLFPLATSYDLAFHVIRIYTTKRKYNKLVKKVGGRKMY